MRKIPLFLAAFSLLVFIFISCQKDVNINDQQSGKQNVLVYMNDDPHYDFTKVLVDIRYVEVKVDTSHNGNGYGHHHHDDDHDGDDDHHHHDHYGYWDTIAINPGVFDLLALRNGVDTLIANGFALHGQITKLRLTLGNSNTVWTDSTHSYPLSICDGRPYVYAKVRNENIDTLSGGQVAINLDFDVTKSIRRRNGNYCLQPVLKSYCGRNTGEIEGKVYPFEARPLIRVSNSTDTAYAIPFNNGKYKVRGLSTGTYDVYFDAQSPYQDTTITGVQVFRGRETELPSITLHQ